MISYRLLLLNLLIVLIGIPIIAFLYFMPFNSFVDIDYVHYQDTCSDQELQTVITLREVKWRDEYHATSFEQLFRYDGDEKIETTITRKTDFIYQKSDTPVKFEIDWNKKLPPGEYGVYTTTKIEAGFKKTDIRLEDTQRFKVVECNSIN